MLHVDADELYDLSAAGRMLWADAARIRRWARGGRAPLLRRREGDALPRTWVDAASGKSASDPEGLLRYWLERLAPPPPEARRAARDAARLGLETTLTAAEAARRLFADEPRLRRMDAEGTLPALRVDGETRYDPELVERLAEGDEPAAALRREHVRELARYEYVTGLADGAPPPPTAAPPASRASLAAAPHAWHVPEDIAAMDAEPAEPAEPPPAPAEEGGARLIRAEGFEVLDEEDDA